MTHSPYFSGSKYISPCYMPALFLLYMYVFNMICLYKWSASLQHSHMIYLGIWFGRYVPIKDITGTLLKMGRLKLSNKVSSFMTRHCPGSNSQNCVYRASSKIIVHRHLSVPWHRSGECMDTILFDIPKPEFFPSNWLFCTVTINLIKRQFKHSISFISLKRKGITLA